MWPFVSQTEEEKASERWTDHNHFAQLEGCKCGAAATHVRYGLGYAGAVAPAFYSCAEHRNVNSWTRYSDTRSGTGSWIPDTNDLIQGHMQWMTESTPLGY